MALPLSKGLSFFSSHFKSFQKTEDISNFHQNSQESSKYLWMLIFDLLIFFSLTLTSYTSSKKIKMENQSNSDDFRPKFIKGLVLANGIRTVSLIFIIILGNPLGNNPSSWLNSLLHIVPAFIFVSAYMYLATFLADLYYNSIAYHNHLIKPALLFIVVSGYIILAIVALLTFVFQAFKTFHYISEFLMALLYLILGSLTVYFGRKVSNVFSAKNIEDRLGSANTMKNKLSLLSYSIGGLFLLKGLSGVLAGITLLQVQTFPNIYDFFWFLILEIAPTVIFIGIGRSNNNGNDTPRPTIEMEMDTSLYYRDSIDNTENVPPFMKRIK